MKLSRQSQNRYFECRSLGEIAVLHYCISQLDSAIYYFEEAIPIACADKNLEQESIFYNNIALVFDDMGNYPLAWENYEKSLQINLKRQDNSKIATCYNNMAIILENQGNYEKAMEYYYNAINYAEKDDNEVAVAKYRTNLAYIYEVQGLFDNALKIQQESLAVHSSHGLKPEMGMNLEHIGRIYSKMDLTEKALKYWQQAIDIYTSIENEKGVGIVGINIGNYYTKISQYEDAIKHFQDALVILEKCGDQRNFAACNVNLGNCYLQQKNYKSAEKFTKIGFDHADEMGLTQMKSDAAGVLANVYEKSGKYQSAFTYLQIEKTLSDSLLNESKIREIARMESQFQFDKVLIQRDAEEQRLKIELSQSRLQRNIYIFASLLFCGIAIGLAFILKTIRDKNRKLFLKNVELLQNCQSCEYKNISQEEKYASSNLSMDDVLRIKCQLMELMEKGQIWKNSGIKITDVAETLQTNSTYLSQIINSEYEMNFTNFINEYRIKEAEKLILKGYQENFTLEALATDCGFKSRSTFYAAFKKFTGLTPTKFIALKEESKIQFQKTE